MGEVFPLTFPVSFEEIGAGFPLEFEFYFSGVPEPSPSPEAVAAPTIGDLIISGNSCSVNCWCSRWDVQNWNFIVESWVKKSDLQNLRNSITPGAVSELYTVLGTPHYYDTTWQGNNTIKFIPQSTYGSTLYAMRRERTTVGYVKTITDGPLEGNSGWINVKLECVASSNQSL